MKKVKEFKLVYAYDGNKVEKCRINIEGFTNKVAFIFDSEKCIILGKSEIICQISQALVIAKVGYTKRMADNQGLMTISLDEHFYMTRENSILIFSYIPKCIKIEEIESSSYS